MQAPLESKWAANLVNVNDVLQSRVGHITFIMWFIRLTRPKHLYFYFYFFFKLEMSGLSLGRLVAEQKKALMTEPAAGQNGQNSPEKCPCTTRRTQRWDNTASCAAWLAEPLWAIGVKRWSQTMISSSNNCFTCGGSRSPPLCETNTAHTVLGTK